MKSKLIFIYNANSGVLNASLDIAHKIFSPSTYQCNLCAITHGTFKEHKSWKRYRENTKIDMEFLHIDEFEDKYKPKSNNEFAYPTVLIQEDTDKELSIFITTVVLNELKNTDDLINLITDKMKCIST